MNPENQEISQRIIDRVRFILFDLNMTDTEFSKACGISMGVLSNAKKPGKDLSELQCRRILAAYPFINEQWLMTGEGERYNDGRAANIPYAISLKSSVGDQSTQFNCNNINLQAFDKFQSVVNELLEQNKKMLDIIATLTNANSKGSGD